MRIQDPPPAYVQTVEEITQIYRSLPPRSTIEEVEAAASIIRTVAAEEEVKLDRISKQETPPDVPQELFGVLQQLRKTLVLFQSHEQRKEAARVLELDEMFIKFDDLIRRASELVSGREIEFVGSGEVIIREQNLFMKKEMGELRADSVKVLERSCSTKAAGSSVEGDKQKLSMMKVAAFIENAAKTREGVLDLQGKLMDQIEWLPLSVGKLRAITELNLSENSLVALPSTIGSLSSLTKLDLHSNQLINLPDSIGELTNLTFIDIHANRLSSLPVSFKNLTQLVHLDLSSNNFTHLPDTIGNLTSLEMLNVETNELEELPYSIGFCSSLTEMRLDFNRIKALPEAIGKLKKLEILTLHYNKIKGLPTTMGTLSNLRELDVSFNELESVPENLCLAGRLEKLNVGKNFADLRALPNSIGNLEMLAELDISDNQIRVLPNSFRFLSRLHVFRADETPLEWPPKEVVKQGAQTVVQYINDVVAKAEAASVGSHKTKKRKGFKSWSCFVMFSWQRSNPEN